MSDKIGFWFSEEKRPGTWRGVLLDGKPAVKIICPKCGIEGDLSDHTILPTGRAEPSVKCPTEDCDFHASVLLIDFRKEGTGTETL